MTHSKTMSSVSQVKDAFLLLKLFAQEENASRSELPQSLRQFRNLLEYLQLELQPLLKDTASLKSLIYFDFCLLPFLSGKSLTQKNSLPNSAPNNHTQLLQFLSLLHYIIMKYI